MLRETDLLNEELEGYHITVELDSRPTGRIFLGDSISPNTPCQRVIVKLLNTTHSDILPEQQRILDTISSLQQLHHPHILPIQSAGIYKDIPYLISEYITSGSLQDRLQNGYVGHPMPLEDALPILTDIGQALHYAHQQHIVHGNIKPQNVLLTIQNDVFLTDFHLYALSSPEKTDDTHPLEISTYWAPEQLSGNTNEKSDQYALACIAYELLTGCKAFMVPSVKSPGMYYKTKSLIAPGRFNPTLPPYIEEAILKAMSREPAQRYPDINAFLYAMGLPLVVDDANQPADGITFDPPVTPLPTINTITLAKIALSRDTLTSEETHILADLDDPTLPALNVVTPTEIQSSSPLAALDLPRLSLLNDNHPTLKTSLYAAINRPPFDQVWQKFTPLRQHSLPLSLLAVVIILGLLFIGLNSLVPANKLGTTPYTSATTTTQFPPQTNPSTPITNIPSTSSSTPGIIPSPQGSLPYSTSTPNIALLPTPTSALTPGATPTYGNSPNPTPTYGNSPDPTPTHGNSPDPTPTRSNSPDPTPTRSNSPQPPPVQNPAPQPTPTPFPTPQPTPTPTPTTSLTMVPLFSLFNNEGIGFRPGMANFDRSGYSYASQTLPSGGTITVQGVPYQFPGSAPATNDNIIPFGQTVSITPGNYQQASLLVAASWGPDSGTITIQYTDGSTSTASITVPDWYHPTSSIALTARYRYSPNNVAQNTVYIYNISIPLDPTRTAYALILPRGQSGPYHNGTMHIFSLTMLP